MTKEEKAKAYDKVREKIAIRFGSNVADEIFSQFEMSEDERIRKDVYNYLYNERHNIRQLTPYTDELDRWLAWLEKQKPINISIEDKRIRKSLINYVKAHGNGGDFTKEKYIAWLEKQESVEEIVERCKNSWYNEGKIDGMAEGLTEDEKYQQGWHDALEKQDKSQDKGEISDGYHTFNELYYYRMLYNAAFFNMLPKEWVHKSKRHNDGEECFGGGWFIVMANLPTGQISNHYELKDWDLFQIPEKEVADKWDGHTPQEAADRLHKYLLENQGKQETTYNKEKLNVLNFIRRETCCGLAEANNALLKLIKVLKEQPSPIMDKSYKLKIEWEEQQ